MNNIIKLFESILPDVEMISALLFFLLILCRFLVMSMMMPFLGAQLLPSLVRIGLCCLLSAVSFILLFPHTEFSVDINAFFICLLFLKEAFLGFILGFLASLIFYAYELFGELIDFARAASMSRMLVPELKQQSSPMGVLFFQLSLVIFISAGFHREIIRSIYKSFVLFPVMSMTTPIMNRTLWQSSVEILALLFEIALRFSLPIVLTCFLVDFAFGLMNRVAPQINAYFLSMPAKMLCGLLMLFLVLPFLIDDFAEHFLVMSRFFDIFLTP